MSKDVHRGDPPRLGNLEHVEAGARRIDPFEDEREVAALARSPVRQRNPALAGDRPELERLEHIARHWLTEDERVALVRWLHLRASRGESLVPTHPLGRPERRKG